MSPHRPVGWPLPLLDPHGFWVPHIEPRSAPPSCSFCPPSPCPAPLEPPAALLTPTPCQPAASTPRASHRSPGALHAPRRGPERPRSALHLCTLGDLCGAPLVSRKNLPYPILPAAPGRASLLLGWLAPHQLLGIFVVLGSLEEHKVGMSPTSSLTVGSSAGSGPCSHAVGKGSWEDLPKGRGQASPGQTGIELARSETPPGTSTVSLPLPPQSTSP